MNQDEALSMNDSYLRNLKKIVVYNLENEHFSVEELADKAGISRSQLHRKLKQLVGLSVSEFIRNIRLEEAVHKLKNNTGTISEIAYQTGFSSPGYFNKVFQKQFKVSPGEFKKDPSIIDASLQTQLITIQKDKKPFYQRKKNRPLMAGAAGIAVLLIIGIIAISAHPDDISIAVLPLDNLTGTEGNQYFVEGMHDALIGELGRIGSLRVISRKSTLRYRNEDMLLADIAKDLKVNTIVEGSVYSAGDSLRLTIQLIEVFPKEHHLWAKDYHESMERALQVQTFAIKDIADNIKVKLSDEENEALSKQRTVNPETYKDYLRGMYYMKKGSHKAFEEGLTYLHRAIERDPADPLAYAGLALGYASSGHGLSSEDAFLKAKSAALKAIEIDPTLDEAHLALALLYLYSKWDWEAARIAFEGALEVNPNNEIAHAHVAWYHILFDDKEKTLYHGEKAVQLDPFSAGYISWLSLIYWYFDEPELAKLAAIKSLEISKYVPYSKVVLSQVYLEQDSLDKAIEYIEMLPDTDNWNTYKVYIYSRTNQMDKALAIWNEAEERNAKKRINGTFTGGMAAALGYYDKAFKYFNEAVEYKDYPIPYVGQLPYSNTFKDDPRYQDLRKKLNLPYKEILLADK